MPALSWEADRADAGFGEWVRERALAWFPLVSYTEDQPDQEVAIEDGDTVAMILEAQSEAAAGTEAPEEAGEETETGSSASDAAPAADIPMDKLRDFEYLLSNYYTVDSSTVIGSDQLDAEKMLEQDMKIDTETGGPKILVFHTHSQEEFVDSTPGNPATSIVGVGAYLTELLNEKGIETIHDTGVYDIGSCFSTV